jgi:hypothetical protein
MSMRPHDISTTFCKWGHPAWHGQQGCFPKSTPGLRTLSRAHQDISLPGNGQDNSGTIDGRLNDRARWYLSMNQG